MFAGIDVPAVITLLAEAGPIAAPTASVLMASAATMATSVRVKGDCDDI